MKKTRIVLGYFTTFFCALYAVLKLLKLPGAANVMLLAGLLIAIYFPIVFLRQLQQSLGMKTRLVHKFGAILLSVVIISIFLRFQHWSIVRYENGEIIRILTFSPWIYIVAYCSFSFIFIPWLLFDHYKYKREGFLMKCVGGLGLSIIPLSLIGADLHLSNWGLLFTVGNAIIILIYLPWHLLTANETSNGVEELFKILIISYILLMLVSGIFWQWPVTYQDVILNAK